MILSKAQARVGLMTTRCFATKPKFPHIGYRGRGADKEEDDTRPLTRQQKKQQATQQQTQMEIEEDQERAKAAAKVKEVQEAVERQELPPSQPKEEEEDNNPMAPIGLEAARAIRASANLPPLIEPKKIKAEEPLTGWKAVVVKVFPAIGVPARNWMLFGLSVFIAGLWMRSQKHQAHHQIIVTARAKVIDELENEVKAERAKQARIVELAKEYATSFSSSSAVQKSAMVFHQQILKLTNQQPTTAEHSSSSSSSSSSPSSSSASSSPEGTTPPRKFVGLI